MKALKYTCVFVMDCEGYDPYVTTFVATTRDEACQLSWHEVEDEWDLTTDEDFELPRENERGRARMVACVRSSVEDLDFKVVSTAL